ncbi:HNH endonuclease signature motif containing protein [Nocardioides piscis]|uniref:HNH endonuclease signature motif containing protein n=1 Tax=Nocardioides piscis TaxID=2714938 RepID=UPI001FE503FB|nr:HNH endonuclease signature motif containing protein [Nocardioides piscis]
MSEAAEWRAPGVPASPSPVLAEAISRVTHALDELVAVSPTSLSDEDVVRLVDIATTLVDRASGVVAAALGEADHRRLGDAIGARHTAQWWARRSRLTRPEAHRLTRLARRLTDSLHAPVQAALAGGEVHLDQAGVIVAAVDSIPTNPADLPANAEPPAVLKARAIEHLLIAAKDHDAVALKILGRRILDIVAPAVGEAAEAKALADEEAAAARKVTLTLRDNHDGTTTGRFTIPTAAAEAMRKQLLAITNPRHQAVTDPDSAPVATPAPEDPRPLYARLGWALVEWIEGYPCDLLPAAGGTTATVVVTMGLDTLLGGLAAASLDTGTRISPGHARRLACEAGIIPAVLGGPCEVLDLGRTRRFHTKAQRLAMALRDNGCTAEGCDLPPAACHAHHDHPWSEGGPTNTTTGRLLCHRHHRLIHDPHYDTTHLPGGKVAFHRRT